jgi:hypothetical protein
VQKRIEAGSAHFQFFVYNSFLKAGIGTLPGRVASASQSLFSQRFFINKHHFTNSGMFDPQKYQFF